MIYNIYELEPITSISEQIELNDIIPVDSDVLEINQCQVVGTIKNEVGKVVFDLKITAHMVQACALTLKPVEYNLEFESEIIFSDDLKIHDYVLESTIDLRPIILAYIMTEKPYTVFHPDADHTPYEEQKDVHPAFEQLKNLKK